jgi:tetratricopeptide (TPR) repeat protein
MHHPQPSKSYSEISTDFFKRARAAMTAGDIPFAIGLLEKVVEESSGDQFVSGLALLAECYAAVGEYGKAADAYDRIVAMNPDSAIAQNARYEVGRLAMDRLVDLPRARAAFTAYVASPRGGALKEEAYYSLCELDSRAGAHYSAAHCFNEFLHSFPDGHRAPDAMLQRGAFYQELENRWPDAERDLLAFIKAKPLHPRTEEARYRVVLGRYQMHDERGALRMIDEYLRKHPNGQYKLRVTRIKQSILSPDIAWKNKSK